MKSLFNNRFLIFVIALSVAIVACQFSYSTANFGDVYTSQDRSGRQPSDVYLPMEDFYVVVELKNAPDSTELEVVWYAVDVDKNDGNGKLSSEKITTPSTQLPQVFSLKPDLSWGIGKYRVDLLLNGEKEESVEFQVVPAQMSIFG